jgi:hypothetical protein
MKYKNDIFFFAKFGKCEHISALRDEGKLYMQSLSTFRNMVSDNQIADKFEGLTKSNITCMEVNGYPIKSANSGMPTISGELVQTINGHIFSVVGINRGMVKKKIWQSIEIDESYDTVLLITNPRILVERIVAKSREWGIVLQHGIINYADPDPRGEKPCPFRKRLLYKEQYEYRFFIPGSGCDAITFEIGDISDITLVFDKNKFKQQAISPKLT